MPRRSWPQHLLLLAALAVVQAAGNDKAQMDQPGAGIDAQKRELERQHQERRDVKRTPEQQQQYEEQVKMDSPEHTGAILLHATEAVAVALAHRADEKAHPDSANDLRERSRWHSGTQAALRMLGAAAADGSKDNVKSLFLASSPDPAMQERHAAVHDPMFWNRAGVHGHLEEAKKQLIAQHRAPAEQSQQQQQEANRSWDIVLDWLDVELDSFAKAKTEL